MAILPQTFLLHLDGGLQYQTRRYMLELSAYPQLMVSSGLAQLFADPLVPSDMT